MKDFATAPRRKAMAHADERPRGYPTHSACLEATMELVAVSPDRFLRLENMGKRKKRKIRLAHVSILDGGAK